MTMLDIIVTAPGGSLSGRLARQIGVAPPLPGEEPAKPKTKLGWAMHWARRGIHVFPCQRWLGRPLVPKWYSAATTQPDKLVDWWSEWPEADIGAVPNASGHYVIAACGQMGRNSLAILEIMHGKLEPEFRYETRWHDQHLWFHGKDAISSRDDLGLHLHLVGPGCMLYMPPSLAPDLDTDCE
jgi:hypothetical protein